MRQAWLPVPEPDFLPARVRIGWQPDALVVAAELPDRDIFNPITEFNQAAFLAGDAFEMFLRPEWQAAYYEFHVTPGNQLLQLRFASAAAFQSCPNTGALDDRLAAYKILEPRISTQTQVDAAAKKWTVQAVIPFALVVETGAMQPGARWLCSFCRYDYTRGQTAPVLSSTSPHVVCSFHRQHEWQPVEFPGG